MTRRLLATVLMTALVTGGLSVGAGAASAYEVCVGIDSQSLPYTVCLDPRHQIRH